jgi:hypothetical protein
MNESKHAMPDTWRDPDDMLADPSVRQAFDKTAPQYALARCLIDQGLSLNVANRVAELSAPLAKLPEQERDELLQEIFDDLMRVRNGCKRWTVEGCDTRRNAAGRSESDS